MRYNHIYYIHMNTIHTGPAIKSTIPDHLVCPIGQEIYIDPVTTILGYTYERVYIEGWLEDHDTDPLTNEKLSSKVLAPNRAIKSAVEEFKANIARGL
jgi:hypothetical protein